MVVVARCAKNLEPVFGECLMHWERDAAELDAETDFYSGW